MLNQLKNSKHVTLIEINIRCAIIILLMMIWFIVSVGCAEITTKSHDRAIQGENVTTKVTAKQAYLFSSFRGNGNDGLHLAYSYDGLKWTALKNDKSFLKPKVGGKLMRDPCIIQGPDGLFHMVWTSSWRDKGIGIAHSKDLIEWTEQKFIPVMGHDSTARNCWAPEINWDPDGKQYVIYWATTIPGHFSETAKSSEKGWNHRMYCTTTKDFKSYTKTKLFYEPGFNVIDSTIIRSDNRYVMILKDETRDPVAKNLRVATSEKVTGPWSEPSIPFSPKKLWVEGPTCLKVGDYWYVYFDAYRKHRYGVMRTKDFKNWQDVTAQLSVPKGIRHGTVFPVSKDVLKKLLDEKPAQNAGQDKKVKKIVEKPKQVYIFSSFRGNGNDGLHLAYSYDGLKWTALKNDKSFLKPKVVGCKYVCHEDM